MSALALTCPFPSRRQSAPPVIPLVVYGRRSCGLSQMVRRRLDRLGMPYDYVDLDLDPQAEARLSWLTGGRVQSPVVSIGGKLLVQPTIAELEQALRRSGRRW